MFPLNMVIFHSFGMFTRDVSFVLPMLEAELPLGWSPWGVRLSLSPGHMGNSWYGWMFILIRTWLVVWNMTFMTFHILGIIIIPTDELIFFRGVGIPPTRNGIYRYWSIAFHSYIYFAHAFWFENGVPKKKRTMKMASLEFINRGGPYRKSQMEDVCNFWTLQRLIKEVAPTTVPWRLAHLRGPQDRTKKGGRSSSTFVTTFFSSMFGEKQDSSI